jgi:ubiquinone/menaquinone biosynthesis C-methylase UbiE
VSSDYIQLDGAQSASEAERLRSAWKSDDLPLRQRRLVDPQIARFRAGKPVDVFDVMVRSLRPLQIQGVGASLLEVGCSSGFYSEVLAIADINFQYSGCDYSEAFIVMAKSKYPNVPFRVEDATALSYEDSAFDVVVSGCCLLHIPEYATAVKETARVASQYAIFHRTPMVLGQANRYYRKQAYGVETVEIHFNEPEFLALLAASGLTLIATHTLDEVLHNGIGTATRTYVCKKL